MNRIAAFFCIAIALSGCTVISYNRAFPKLDWVWSHDAKVQREEKRIEKEFYRTNSLPKYDKP